MLLKFILFLIVLTPKHELNKNAELREEVKGYFEDSGKEFGFDPSWLIYYANRESSLRIDKVGGLGEVGYAQVHGGAKVMCEEKGYDPLTRRGGAMCMGYLMRKGVKKCGGDFIKGMAWYASGSCDVANKKMSERYRSYCRKWRGIKSGRLTAEKRRRDAMRKYLEDQRMKKVKS